MEAKCCPGNLQGANIKIEHFPSTFGKRGDQLLSFAELRYYVIKNSKLAFEKAAL